LQIIHNMKKKLIAKKQKLQTTTTKKRIKFSYHSPLIRKITNLFKHTNLNIALRATNTIHQQLADKIVKTSTNSSGIYKLKCNTCNNSYVGQSERSVATRHKEHTRYIRTKNPISAYALHILSNKRTKMNCWEALYMQAFRQRNVLIEEQKVSNINPLYELAQHVTQPVTHSLTQCTFEQCSIHTTTRVSPTIFDTIYLILKILLIQYLIDCYSLQTY